MNNLVTYKKTSIIADRYAITTTRTVATVFGKKHKNILQAVENLDCSEEFSRLNFQLSTYRGKRRSEKQVEMTRDGLVFLVMGFTGKQAAKFKEAYIKQFNKMESFLIERGDSSSNHRPMISAAARAPQYLGEDIATVGAIESNLINELVFGMTSAEYKKEHDVINVRDHASKEDNAKIAKLQEMNITLLKADKSYEERFEILTMFK